ncbi:MaoC/PaaZ C-terminal domain-containing protein [Sulfitobacter dubius]|uniref:Bifunctional protein PaaZ n=1 Tax=Sulfitobacter dubius TaxID=218673 RepID=A0ABY3ZRN4_9RHOB|nr:MaoC/PaaZ C-terminal domain-containing protein [Sulfitobacter dubius]UOA17203.1 Bifunctional protein PaaZ [Sulfitobacter dubius]
MIDRPFPELEIGEVKRSRGRTLTETDVVNFCMLTGNWLEIHANAEFAKATSQGERIVQGSLIFSIVNALLPFDSSVVQVFYGVDRLRFLKPSFIGDTVWAHSKITELKPRADGTGIATCELQGLNQRGETVMRCDFSLLVRATRLLATDNTPFS